MADSEVRLWIPGSNSRRAVRSLLAMSLVVLVVLGSFSHLLPGMFQFVAVGTGAETTDARPKPPAEEGPKISLPPGSIHYGSRGGPRFGQAVNSAIPSHLTITSEAFQYQTSYGLYLFDREAPFVFSIQSRSGAQLTEGSAFFVASFSSVLTTGLVNVTKATNTAFEVRYEILSAGIVVGFLLLNADFYAETRPKFTASFSKTWAWNSGSFNIVWSTALVDRWLKRPETGPVLDLEVIGRGLQIPGISKVEVGPSDDVSSWREWVMTDWSDSPGGRLEVGDRGLANLLTGPTVRALTVVFPTNTAIIDPTQVATTTIDFATAYSNQRKTFSYGGYYFVFWYDGSNIVYSTSLNGQTWSSVSSTGSGLVGWGNFDVYQSGPTVALTWMKYDPASYGDKTTNLMFRKGISVGGSIAWDPIRTLSTLPQPYTYVPSVAIGTDGNFWAGGIWYNTTNTFYYHIWIYRSTDGGVTFTESTRYLTSNSGSRIETLQLVPLAQGKLMALSSHYYDTTIRWRIWNPVSPTGPYWASVQSLNLNFLASTAKSDRMSAVSTSDGFVHLISQQYVGGTYYLAWTRYNSTSGQWTNDPSISGGGIPQIYPSISADSLGNLHVFWTLLSGTTTFGPYYTYRPKAGLNWAAGSQPFGSITNAKWLSAARTATKEVMVAWTLGTASPYQIFVGSLPLPSGVASGPPARPWSRLGLSPYEQYFSQNGEHLSPGNGLLTVGQTDLSVPGRSGLTLSITRLYVQPFTFSQGSPFNYQTSPYANLGNGWRLDLPWVTHDTSQVAAQYLHYPNGQLFPLVWTSSATNVVGTHVIKTFIMENHETEDFVFSRTDDTDTSTQTTTTTYKMTTKDGTMSNFNGLGVLTSMVDRTGQNQLSFSYSSGTKLSTITDTVGRQAIFNHDANNRLSNVTYGSRLVRYTYSGNNLWTITDPAERTTNLRYSPLNSWLLSGVIYSSGGNSTYTYGSVTVGTDALNYYVTLRNVFSGSLVRTSSFSYNITDGEVTYTSIKQSDGLAVQGYTDYEFNTRAGSMTRTIFNATRVQMIKHRFWYDTNGRPVQEDVYSGNAPTRSFYNSRSYDEWGNMIYTRDNIGHESYQSYANTTSQYAFYGPGKLSTATEGLRLYDDFNGPNLNGATWIKGGSASGRVTTVADSQLTLKGSSSAQGTWKSNWVRSSGTYNYPVYAEVPMTIGANPGANTTNADFMLSPQATSPTGDPFLNSDGLRLVLADGPYYRVIKRVGGIGTTVYDSGLVQSGSVSISWKIELTDRNTLRVYLNKGTGYTLVYSTTGLGLSTSFAPAYAYVSLNNLNIAPYAASFDSASIYNSNQVSVNGLQGGQRVELYDWQNVLRASGTVPTGQSTITLNATILTFPYGYLRLYELDGRTVQFISPTRELWGGSTYSYTQPSRSGGLTRTSTGFLKSSTVYVEDGLPSPANSYSDGGDAWVWATQSYAPVASGSQSHVGFTATGAHQHYFQEAFPGLAAASGSFHIQYVSVPSSSVPSEIMLQFHDNAVSNPGFETGNFNAWTQTGMIIRSDYKHSGSYSAGAFYDGGTGIYSAFTLQENFAASVAGSRVTSIQLWYMNGVGGSTDNAQVLYTDGTNTQTSLPFVSTWTLKTLSFDSTKQISGIKVIRSTGVTTNLMLDDFVLYAGAWEHRAYWGSNLISLGTDGTASRRPMGALPTPRDSWIMLIVKTDDVATNGLSVDGLAYTLYNGGVYWDYSALGASFAGTIAISNLLVGQKVELYDSNMALKVSGTVQAGQSSVTLDVYSAGINAFPYRGFLKVYTTANTLQYSSPLMTDIWGGDVYSYNQPAFTNRFDGGPIGSSIHNAVIGTAQYQNGTSVKLETYAKYDTTGNLLRESRLHNSALLNTTYTYDTYGNRISELNANNQQTYNTFSATYQRAYLTNSTRVLNSNTNITTSYVYDFSTGFQTAIIDPKGNRTDYQIDALGRMTVMQHPAIGGIRSQVDLFYQDSQNNVDVRNEKGNYTRPEYDGLGRVTTVEKYSGVPGTPILSEERIDYDWQDGVKSYNATGPITTYAYDYQGRLIRVTNSDGTYRTTTYDDINLIQSNIDENQHRTDHVYDPLQRLLAVREYYTATAYHTTSYFYDEVGNLVKTIAANPQVLTFTPTDDAYIRSDQPSTNFGSATTLQVDNSPVKNFLLKFTIAGVGSAQVTSAKLRLYQVDSSPTGGSFYKTTTSTWIQGTVTWNNAPPTQGSAIASLGSVSPNTWYIVDLTSGVTGDGILSLRVTSSNSDGADYTSKEGTSWFIPQLILTISTGQTTSLSYDDLNRLTLTKYPDGFNETKTYDNIGNLISKKDPNGSTISYTYDSLNRLTNVTYPDGSKANFAYDKNGNRISMSNPNSTATFTYDARNRLTGETWTIDGSQYTVNYGYDAVGNLASITYPDGVSVTYSIDPLNRATTVKKGGSALADVTYTATGLIKTISYSNGVSTTQTYDSRDRISRIKTVRGGSTLLDLNYTLDNVGNVLGINTESYTYDFLNRLTYSSGPWLTLQYGYDAIGNRLWMKEGASNSTYVSGSYNRLLSAGSTSYTWDNNGNLRSKTAGSTTTVYNHDFENRLTKVTQGGSTLGVYAYDPFGQRVKKVESGTTTIYLNQGVNVIYEKQGLIVNDYVLIGQMILAKVSGASTFFFHQDHLGSTRLVTIGSTTDFSSNYQPFGPQYAATGTDPVYKYTGQQHDTAIGLYYYGARYYDISVGRFVSRDPARPSQTQPQDNNQYVYTRNNPEAFTDPTGKGTWYYSTNWVLRMAFKVAFYGFIDWVLLKIWAYLGNPPLFLAILAIYIGIIGIIVASIPVLSLVRVLGILVNIAALALRLTGQRCGWWCQWAFDRAAEIILTLAIWTLGYAVAQTAIALYGIPYWWAAAIYWSVWAFVNFTVDYAFDRLGFLRDY